MTFTCEIWTAMQFPKSCLRNEAATKMDDWLPAIFFDFENYGRISTAVQVTKQSFEAAWGAVLGEAGGEDVPATTRWWEAVASLIAAPSAARDALVGAGRLLQNVLGAYWFFVLGASVHIVISGEIPPQQRLQSAEYGLAGARITFWQRSQIPARQPANETRGHGPAWVTTTESLEKLIVTLLIVISELSRLEHPIRGSVLGTMPIEHVFALVRGLCGTDQRAESL
jgi:hypothetical protein